MRLFAVLLLLTVAVWPAAAVDCYREIDPVYLQTDARSTMKAVDPASVARIRSELIQYIWKSPTLPTDLPTVIPNVPNPFWDLGRTRLPIRFHELTFPMDELFVSHAYLLVPERAKRELVIFHHGHSHDLWPANGHGTIRHFLDDRIPVLVVFMPMYGPNEAPWPTFPYFHWPMGYGETPERSVIRYFLEPVIRGINYVEQVLGWKETFMLGVSGGGWTTTLAAAVDPRIEVSVSIAGSVPAYLRKPSCPDKGAPDLEQVHPPLYAIADNIDLYVLAAEGRGRGHMQVVNQFDACCAAGLGYLTYLDAVRNVVNGLRNGGRYDIFLDATHTKHTISPHALEKGIDPWKRRRLLTLLRGPAGPGS